MAIALVCKKCGTASEVSISRADPGRKNERPVCGNCGARLEGKLSSVKERKKSAKK